MESEPKARTLAKAEPNFGSTEFGNKEADSTFKRPPRKQGKDASIKSKNTFAE